MAPVGARTDGSGLLAPRNKTVGVARQQRHFLFVEKENEEKKTWTLRWACLRVVELPQVCEYRIQIPTLPPQEPRLL